MNAVIYVDVYENTGVNVSQCIVPTVTQSHTGLHGRPMNRELYTNWPNCLKSPLFSGFRKCLKLQNWYQNVSVEHY